jgi:hypothetical protein
MYITVKMEFHFFVVFYKMNTGQGSRGKKIRKQCSKSKVKKPNISCYLPLHYCHILTLSTSVAEPEPEPEPEPPEPYHFDPRRTGTVSLL